MSKPLKGFITYSHEDPEAKDELQKRLAVMEQQNELVTWDDGQLTPGDKALQEDILEKVTDSDLLLYLVSAASLASKNCNRELAEALKQNIRVIPIILEHCDWLRHQISNFEVLPHKGKPLTKWEDESEGWQNVVEGIREAVDKVQAEAGASSETSEKELRAELAFQQGNLLIMFGELNMAIKRYSYSINLNPRYASVYYNRGNIYSKKGDFDNAINDYIRVIELNPDDAIAYYNLGNAYSNKGETELAIKNHTKAIELKTDYADAYTNRGNAYYQKGIFDDAINDYNAAIKLNPCYANAYNNRGNAYADKGDLDNAIKNYTEAIQLKSDYAEVYNNRGKTYTDKGEFNLAVEDYDTAIRLNLHLALAYYNRGEAWLHLREWEKAKTDFTTAKRLGVDITAMFHNSYKDVETYQKNRLVKLPENLAFLLTQRRRDRYPKLQKVLDADGNPLESPHVVNLREQLRNVGPPLSEYLKAEPAFGVNTAPTEVFVVDRATRGELIAGHPSSADILKPFLHGQDLRRWHVDAPQQWLIFAHRGIAIDDYPVILKYLESHKETLRKRKGKQAWYELQASLRDVERFAQPKLVCPNTYNHQTFAVDIKGFYYGNTSYLIPTQEKWLCGLLNSQTVEWFYSQVSDQLTIDYLRARSRYIQQIPIPELASTQKALIGKIVDYLIYLQQQPTINSKDLAHARDRVMLRYFERVIDGLVYEAYLPAELHKGDKHFFQPLFEEKLPLIEDIEGDKLSVFRDIFELLYEKAHPIRRNLFFLDSVKPVRIIEGKL